MTNSERCSSPLLSVMPKVISMYQKISIATILCRLLLSRLLLCSPLISMKVTDELLPDGLKIDGDLGEEPVLVFKAGAASPDGEESIVVAEGNGPVITSDQTVVYHYIAQYWGEEHAATTTWDVGPEAIPAANSLFLGEHVGSRLLLLIPATGEDQPAMVMIVDILDAYTP